MKSDIKKLKREMKITGKAARKMNKKMKRETPGIRRVLLS